MQQPDRLIHQPLRLHIVLALNALPERDKLEFTRLKATLGATDGNLGAHLGLLEKAGYLSVEKDFVGKKPRTRCQLTRAGRRAFDKYVAFLRDVVATAGA
jgi:DNA-binding MarR family transcriptional regulator